MAKAKRKRRGSTSRRFTELKNLMWDLWNRTGNEKWLKLWLLGQNAQLDYWESGRNRKAREQKVKAMFENVDKKGNELRGD